MATTYPIAVNATPLADRIVVKPLDEHGRTTGGLYIPDTAKEKPQHGEIVAVGSGKFEHGALVPMSLKVGDRVLYGRYNGIEVTLEGYPYLILRESDVLAVVS